MTTQEMAAAFQTHEDNNEFLEFGRIENPQSKRPDLNAFLLLDRLVPGTTDVVNGSVHDEFWLGFDMEAVAAVITDAQILELVRCGVMYDEDADSFRMFS